MNLILKTFIILKIVLLLTGCNVTDSTPDETERVDKTNTMKIYMHYMPWYHSKEVSGYWGSHWRMANRNPDNIDENGLRDIASHYYPLIGPYDSQDEDVIEYHLLLMKYAGVDALLIDWYGVHRVFDYRPNFENSNALINRLPDVGLDYAIVYEEFTAEHVENQTNLTAIEAARQDVEYMQTNYFIQEEYLRIDNNPLLLTFGPRYFRQEQQWDQIFDELVSEIKFLPLWNHIHRVGQHADGEFSWIDFNEDLSDLSNFYNRIDTHEILIGSAFPRFHDFYEEGGWGSSYGRVYSNNGEMLEKTLQKAKDHELEYLQLATWNDFGEGTSFEPTIEDGFLFLEILQEFTGVPYGIEELELVHSYYLKRKQFKGDEEKEEMLDQVFAYLSSLNVENAKALMNEIKE